MGGGFDPFGLGVAMVHHGWRDARQFLDVPEISPLARIAERQCRSAGAGSRRTADAVHVAFRLVRQLVVDDMRNPRHIDASCGNIRGDENASLPAAERIERPYPGILRLVAVDGLHGKSGLPEKLADLIGTMLGAREDQHAIHSRIGEQLHQ